MTRQKLPLDHASQFKSCDRVFITRYGDREDWAYPMQAGAVITFRGSEANAHVNKALGIDEPYYTSIPVPAMPEVIEATFVEMSGTNAIIQIGDDHTWQVPVGFVKTEKWVAEWQTIAVKA